MMELLSILRQFWFHVQLAPLHVGVGRAGSVARGAAVGAPRVAAGGHQGHGRHGGRGLRSSTFQLNVSIFGWPRAATFRLDVGTFGGPCRQSFIGISVSDQAEKWTLAVASVTKNG